MSNLFNINSIRFNSYQTILSDWSLVKIKGPDAESFLQGQLTNDVKKLEVKTAQYTTRLNRTGKIQSYAILAKAEDCYYFLVEKKLEEVLLSDLEKFLIMDDVEFEKMTSPVHALFNPSLKSENKGLFNVFFYGIPALIATESFSAPEADLAELEEVRILNGYPLWDKDISSDKFLNDTYFNEIGISYKKGCFLGQETVAKIENNRGAAYYPVLLKKLSAGKAPEVLKLEDKKVAVVNYDLENYLQVSLLRDYRVSNKILEFENGLNYKVEYLPFFKAQSNHELAQDLYDMAVSEFQKENVDYSLELLKKSIQFDPAFADAYETVGVILGRKAEYEEAITWMDQLLAVNSASVMAHTNKSLFLMKLGRIEEAEAEKGMATVKSFAVFGEEAKLKKALEAEKQKKEADMLKREGMFKQVLEIDEDDTVALYGLADIAFYREEYKTSVENLEKVVKLDEKYSVAYLLLGKSLEATGNLERAMQVYKKGIDVASKRGDMMPANEMQSRLNQLVMSSGLA